jgi:hypothetical protein
MDELIHNPFERRIPERVFGSRDFIARTRRPDLPSPKRFEPTVKGENDVVI